MTPSQSQDRLQAKLNFVLALEVVIVTAGLVTFILIKVGLTQPQTSVALAGLGLITTAIGSVVGHAQDDESQLDRPFTKRVLVAKSKTKRGLYREKFRIILSFTIRHQYQKK